MHARLSLHALLPPGWLEASPGCAANGSCSCDGGLARFSGRGVARHVWLCSHKRSGASPFLTCIVELRTSWKGVRMCRVWRALPTPSFCHSGGNTCITLLSSHVSLHLSYLRSTEHSRCYDTSRERPKLCMQLLDIAFCVLATHGATEPCASFWTKSECALLVTLRKRLVLTACAPAEDLPWVCITYTCRCQMFTNLCVCVCAASLQAASQLPCFAGSRGCPPGSHRRLRADCADLDAGELVSCG